MEKKVIHTNQAPQAIGPYSQAVLCSGQILFISGQIPVVPSTWEIVSDEVAAQIKQCMENVKAILAEAGATFDNVVKTSIFIKNMNDFSVINEIYGSYFKSEPPARACVEVARLPKDVLVEVEAIAVI